MLDVDPINLKASCNFSQLVCSDLPGYPKKNSSSWVDDVPVHRNAIGFIWYSSLADTRAVLLRLFRLSNKVSTLYSGMTRWRDAAIFWMRVTVVQMLDGSFSAPATSHLSLRGAQFIRSVISVSVNSVEASLTMASGHVCWMILLLSSLATTIAYAPGFTLSLANACRTPPGVVPTSIKPISSPQKLWPSCNAAKASKSLGSRDEVRQTLSPVADASLATTKGLVRKRRSKSISGRWHKASA